MERSWAWAVWVLVAAVAAAVVVGLARSRSEARAGIVAEARASVLARDGAAPLAQARARAAATDLRLNEILAGPSRDWDGDGTFVARQDEWLEVRNDGAGSLELEGYLVSDTDSTIRFALSGSLAPGAALLVTGKMAEDWQRSVGRTVSGLSLNNTGDAVRLFHIEGADTVEVDVKVYNSIEGATDRSTGRLGGGAMWALFDGLNPYTGSGQPQGTGCAPTPGFDNECPTDVERTTWGKIKMRYR